MKKLVLASMLTVAAFSTAHAEDVIKNELALGCVEKEVAISAAAEMAKYVELINKKDQVDFSEDCEIFMKGDSVVVVDREEGADFIKAQRPSQIKAFWLPNAAVGKAEEANQKEAAKK